MRFYKFHQARMLHRVSFMLQGKQDELAKKVPALREFISKFAEHEKALYAIQTNNPHAVEHNTLEKQITRTAFVKALGDLIAVLKAADYKYKNKPPEELSYTKSDLNTLTAEKLCRTYLTMFNAAKKIRNLQYYGLSNDDMHDIQAYYKEFVAIKNAPALKKKEVATRNDRLNEGVKEGIAFLEKHIDPLMRIATRENPKLADQYKGIRKVLPRTGKPTEKEAAYRKSRSRKKSATDEQK